MKKTNKTKITEKEHGLAIMIENNLPKLVEAEAIYDYKSNLWIVKINKKEQEKK